MPVEFSVLTSGDAEAMMDEPDVIPVGVFLAALRDRQTVQAAGRPTPQPHQTVTVYCPVGVLIPN